MYHLTYLCLSFTIIQLTSTADLYPRVYDSTDLQDNIDQYLVYLDLHDLKSTGACSGSILSNRWVISAAHCVEGNIKHVKVQKRQYKRVHTIDLVPFLKLIAEVDQSGIKVHPDYVQELDTFKNAEKDLALLKTTEAMIFDSDTKPISLAGFRPQIGNAAILAGYGYSDLGFKIPRMGGVMLTKCEMPGRNTKLLCSHSTVRAGPGDSGGPLVSKGKLVGVISSGCEDVQKYQYCETYYVNIMHHLDWIKQITGIK